MNIETSKIHLKYMVDWKGIYLQYMERHILERQNAEELPFIMISCMIS